MSEREAFVLWLMRRGFSADTIAGWIRYVIDGTDTADGVLIEAHAAFRAGRRYERERARESGK